MRDQMRVCMQPVAMTAAVAAVTANKCLKDQNQTGKSVDKFRTFLVCSLFFSLDGWNGECMVCNKMLDAHTHTHTPHTQIGGHETLKSKSIVENHCEITCRVVFYAYMRIFIHCIHSRRCINANSDNFIFSFSS